MSLVEEGSTGGSPGVFRLHDASTLVPAPREKRLAGGHRCVTWRPARDISKETREWLYSMLVDVSSQAFGADMTDYWRGRRADGYFDQLREFSLLLNNANEIIGWTGYQVHRFAGSRCLYLDSTGILPGYRGHGLTDRLQMRAIAREIFSRPAMRLYLLVRTESPIIYELLRTGVGDAHIFPSPDRPTPRHVREIAAETAALLGQADLFDKKHMRITGAYSDLEALYGELPKCRDAKLNEFFVKHLLPVDAFIVVAEATVGRIISHGVGPWLRRYRTKLRTSRRH